MKSGPDFEQGADAAVNVDAADRRLGNSIQYLEECAFARAIAADNPEHFAGFDIKRNILERPKRFRCRSSIACQTLSQASRQSRKFIVESLVAAQTLVRDAERLTQILNGKRDLGHLCELNNVGEVTFDSAKEKRAAQQKQNRHSDRNPKHVRGQRAVAQHAPAKAFDETDHRI